ncbi:hypothetical protein BT96DRAFT_922347 [Gymnopus androsaceus JB14]|uniref:Uncharacterized protein n=1 Tax=Gymnopus androsaceus JB14 TaxID=1447944 RepID=A0A6A4HCN1_9AGAR|nr:hypothetical protein BT96DRAFT_922347 [Gymnopus androsaceus JB14]
MHKTLSVGEVSSDLRNGKVISATGRDHSGNEERKNSHVDDIEEHIERSECRFTSECRMMVVEEKRANMALFALEGQWQ